MRRLFAALPMPEDVQDRLDVLSHMLPLSRRVPCENYHLTLAFLGDAVPDDIGQAAHEAFEGIRLPPVTLTFRGAGVFGGAKPRSVHAEVLPDPGLSRLQAKVETAARRAGAPVENRRFAPHVTLSRPRPHQVDLPRLEAALLQVAGFTIGPVTFDAFALYESHLGPDGPTYDELARYPLG